MPSSSKNSTETDLSGILEGLLGSGVRFVLVGGLAAVVQGAPVTTMDVDIVHERSSENIARLLEFLHSIDAIHRRPDDKVIAPTTQDISGSGHALYSTRLGPLDVLAVIEMGKAYEDLVDNSVEIRFRGHALRVLDLKTLIELKRGSHNPVDRQRLPVLEETLRQSNRHNGNDPDVESNEDRGEDGNA